LIASISNLFNLYDIILKLNYKFVFVFPYLNYFLIFPKIISLFIKANQSMKEIIKIIKYNSGQVLTLVICSGSGVGSFISVGVSETGVITLSQALYNTHSLCGLSFITISQDSSML